MAVYCSDVETLSQTYLDGELAEHELYDFEAHLVECEACRARVDEESAFHTMLRAELAAPDAPASLHDRIQLALDAEDSELATYRRNRRWAWALPGSAALVAAASLALFVTQGLSTPSTNVATKKADTDVGYQAVTQHIRRSPVEVRGAAVTPWIKQHFMPGVEPPRFSTSSMKMQGARLSHLRGRNAAQLFYKVSKGGQMHDVQIHIFDAANMKMSARSHQLIGGRDVGIDRQLGYSVVTFKDQEGIGYVFTSDMSHDDLLDLVVSSDLVMRIGETLKR